MSSCGDEGVQSIAPPPNHQGTDFVTLSRDGGAEVGVHEASGLPNIDCDPRVDWGYSQIVMWKGYTGAAGTGYETVFDIMFPLADSVGTYTVHDNSLQAYYHDGVDYMASPIHATSAGTVVVTRSDSHIEGSFDFTLVDASETTTISLAGTFGVQRGFSLSCP